MWKETIISKQIVKRAKSGSIFLVKQMLVRREIIVAGKLYVKS